MGVGFFGGIARCFVIVAAVGVLGFETQAEFDGGVDEGADGVEGNIERFGGVAEIQRDGETVVVDGQAFVAMGRELEACPFEMALDALDELSDADELVLLIHREPGPLYAYLVQNGFAYRTEAVDDGTFRILIRREAS